MFLHSWQIRLYDNQPTYIYHAAIMAPESDKIVGGIGIVFDSSR